MSTFLVYLVKQKKQPSVFPNLEPSLWVSSLEAVKVRNMCIRPDAIAVRSPIVLGQAVVLVQRTAIGYLACIRL